MTVIAPLEMVPMLVRFLEESKKVVPFDFKGIAAPDSVLKLTSLPPINIGLASPQLNKPKP